MPVNAYPAFSAGERLKLNTFEFGTLGPNEVVADARYVAEALAREAFHNVSYFRGSFEEARPAIGH